MIDQFGREYKALRASLIAEYQAECKQVQRESDEAIAAMKERYELKNELIPELTDEQLKRSNSFKVQSEDAEHTEDVNQRIGSNGLKLMNETKPSSSEDSTREWME